MVLLGKAGLVVSESVIQFMLLELKLSRETPPPLVPTQRARVPFWDLVSNKLHIQLFGRPDLVSYVVHLPSSSRVSPPPLVAIQSEESPFCEMVSSRL